MLTPQPDASIAADLPSVDHADIPASVPSTPALTVPSFNPIENVPALPQPTPAQPPVLPQTYRKFGDVAKTRQLIFDNVLKAASTLPPMTNTRHAMHIENVRWSGPETYSIADQKQAILSRGTLGRKLIGEVVLRNPDGTEIERRNTQLARVPYMTDRGTFIVNGNEYTMSHQMRLRPGVFTRMKQNGELESHVNVAKGYSHRIELDPATGVFKVNIGQAHIQLLPLLRAMGVPETKIREAWGNELTSANMQKEDTQAMRKLHEKLFRGKPAGEEGVNQSVVKAFNDMVLDPDVTKRTLGQGFSNVGPDTLLAITNKLLRVAKQEDEPDDRDAMAYQTLVGPEDVLAERIQKSKNILRKLFWKASGRGNLQNVASNSLDDAIRAGLLTSGLGQPLSEINPAEIFDQHSRVTRMGEGGITSMDAVPDAARAVQPSQFGFIDYLRTPECYDYATEVMTRKGWKFWPDVVATDELACQVDGRLEFHVPHVLHRYMYNGEMCGVDTGRINYLVTPNHRVWVRGLFKTAKYHFELADQVKNFRKVQSGGFLPYLGDGAETFRLPHAYISHNPKQVATATNIVNVDHIDVDDWAEFMGWWLGEGSIYYKESNGDGNVSYRVRVSQSLSANPENYRRIEQLLDRLPFKFYKDNDDCGFTLTGKQLTAYLKQFGGSVTRHIPEELLRARTSARQRLMDALLLAEGRRDRSGVRTQFCTTSKQLADDFQRLAFSLGFSTQYVWEPDEREQSNHGGAHIIHVHKFNEHQLHVKRSPSQGGHGDHYRQQYNDYVYCATVPGGLLYVRRQGMLGHWSGNSGKVGVDARIANATVKGDNGQIYTKVRMRDGTDAYKTPQDFADATVAFPNEMTSPDGYVAALQKGRFTMVPRDAVDFEVPNNEDVFSPLGNMIPFKSALKGQRAVMAARMMTQALPLRNAEAPLVQSGIAGEKGVSYEDRYAKHMGAVHAEQPARIIDVNDNGITLVNADGEKKTIQLYHNFPFNQKTYVHQTPMVGVGDIVKPGQLLAKSNFTDDKGTTALGLNARVAYIPWGGLNFEDANVVSESFAKRMSSEHMYQHDHEWESNDKKGLNSFRSIFPAEYDRATLSQFDEHGVIKPGTKVKQGDPLILIARAKELNKKSLLRGTKPIYQNMSQLWENSDEGVVTDVVHTPKGAAVVVKATVPMQVGDKMCFDEDTEVLTTRGWVYIADVLMTDKICTLQHGDEINYLYPTALHRYATGGRMYKIKSQQVDQFVTVNHRQYVRKRNQDTFTLERAENVYGKRVCYKKNGNWQGVSPATVMIDGFDVRAGRSGNGKRRLPDVTLSVETYLTLLGAFISEGNLVNQPKSGTYGIDITQIKQPNRSQIMDELSRLDVHFNEHNHSEKIRIHSKVLYNHFAQFGRTAKEKHLPAEIFNWAKADLQILFRWLMWGDGTVSHVDRPICYTTISPQLADDVQRLCLHIGYAANIVKDNDGGMQTIKGKEYYCQPRYSVRVVTTKLTPMVNHGHTKTQCVQEECVIENYDRPVYCVTVPGHVLYVRRNGKPCWSGNSGRFGDKGIVSHIIPDDQMMTDKDGKPFEVLLNPLGVTSRCYDEQTEFLTDRGWVFGRDITTSDKFACYHVWTEGLFMMDQLHEFHVADYVGDMLLFQNKMMDFCVTPNHRMWAACGYPGAPWQEVTADRIANRKGWKVPVAGLPVPGTDSAFVLPHIEYHVKDTASDRSDIVIDAGDWAEFLGWYIAEGNTDEKVHISQSITANPENCRQIDGLLSRLPFAWYYNAQNTQYHITSKRLCEYLKPFGLCSEKYIPEWVFMQTPEVRARFLDGYLLGDGSKDLTANERAYCGAGTMSERLASDLQRLFIYQGRSANMAKQGSGMWRVGIHAMRHRILEKQNWQTIAYNGKIYCPTVPTGYIVTRRNGKILIAGNTNPAQIIEAALGKVAAMRGEAYKVPDFQNEDDMVEFALGELRKHGLDDSEQLTDPRTNRKIPDVFTGNRWIMKLHHTAESKGQGRGLGAYTAEGTPAKGGAEGAKRIGMLETNALLSHGATQFLRNSSLIRGQSNPQLWAQYMSGNKMPTVAVPHVYHKYVNNLRSAGINVVREGTRLNVMALTDKDIDQLAADREIKNAETVDWKTMEPIKGGLFDTTLTGGHATSEGGGNRWSYIKLHEPLPNPVMEEPIRRVLGLTTNKFNDIISGKERLNDKTGPTAIAEALSNINVDAELARARADIASNKKTARDAAIRRLNFLKSAQRLGIHPKDWMLSRVPVLPPAFRPVSTMGANKLPLVADANYLYKELFDANAGLKEIAKQLDPDDLGDERMAVYNAFKAVTGLGDPTHAKNQERGVKGILKHVFGSSPKLGAVQRRLLGSSTDLVGRAVIAPDPDLDMDQVGLPENQAWTIYRPVLIHKLVRKGMPRLQAARAVEERSQAARTALLDEMDNGVVVINRAPTLHRYGMMAARPRLVKGDVLKISPLVVGGFGADFDGDAMQYHLPVGDEEKQEVMEKMLPSRNLFSAATFKVHLVPTQEYIGGLYTATTNVDDKNPPVVFDTAADAIRAYQQGRLDASRRVHIVNE